MTMHLRTCVAASLVAVAVAAPAFAAPMTASPPATFDTAALGSGNWQFGGSISLLAGVTYSLSLQWDSISGAYAGSNFGAFLYSGVSQLADVFATPTTAGSGATSIAYTAATSGVYDVWFAAYGISAGGPGGAGGSYTVNGLSATVAQVPGPVAAAGLPAGLAALLGWSLYRRRRPVV